MLVGVIMFALILSILGLSLFSLSSFESQFFFKSYDRTQSLQSAIGGIQQARYVLASTADLSRVGQNLPSNQVIWARAKQGADYDSGDSTGNLSGGGGPIWIRALAEVNGERQLVEARFNYSPGNEIYKRLMTLTGDLSVAVTDSGGTNRINQTVLEGEIWKLGGSPGPWPTGCLPEVRPAGSIPTPDVEGSWWSSRYGSATFVLATPGALPNDRVWNLNLSSGLTYYKTEDGLSPEWSLYRTNAGRAEIRVTGTAVWLLKDGLRIEPCARIVGSGPGVATLIIVTRPLPGRTGDEANVGTLFYGGIETSNCNLILVSSGTVKLEHDLSNQDGDLGVTSDYLSIFAQNCRVMGTWAIGSYANLRYTHAVGDARDDAGELIDDLIEQGALPNGSSSGPTRLDLVAGSWRQLQPPLN